MECPKCGRKAEPDQLACETCEALLTPSILRADSPKSHGPPEDFSYTGDLPRLFRFGERYQVLEKLGEGGMGRVYKALDLELDRPVALKTIRSERGVGPDVLKRFKQELVLARTITHKNVVRIHDLGEADGMKFFTMELIEGPTLREYLDAEGRLPIARALDLFKQLMAGLGEAHRQDVVHRDLKPQNILIDAQGTLRIMDFGIARAAGSSTITGAAEIMGTPDYLSPEQVKGEAADARSDLYAAGIVLFELLTGKVPFSGETPLARVLARVRIPPRAPRSLRSDIPAYLERIVLKLLEADPELRYPNVDVVLDDLERERVDRSVVLRLRKLLSRNQLAIASVVLAGSLALGLTLNSRRPLPAVAAEGPVVTIGVLPFHNATGSDELTWMEGGVPDLLITDLSQIPGIRPVLSGRMERALEALGKNGQTLFDDETMRAASDMLKADFAVRGRFVESPGGIRIELTLRESATGLSHPFSLDGEVPEIFALVDEVTDNLAGQLQVDGNRQNRPLSDVSTTSVEAFRTYHEGTVLARRGSNQAAIPLFRKAVALDPSFAMAHASLAKSLLDAGDEADARSAAAEAMRLVADARLSLAERYQVHAIMAQVNDEPSVAVDSYEALRELYPDDADVVLSLADAQELAGNPTDAAESFRKVLELAPDYDSALLGLGRSLVTTGRHEDAITALSGERASSAMEADAETRSMLHSIVGVAYRHLGKVEESASELEKSLELRRTTNDPRGIATSLTNLAITRGMMGAYDDARAELDEALEITRQQRNLTIESFVLVNQAWVEEVAGRPRAALEIYLESLAIEWERGQAYEISDRLNLIGRVYARLGRFPDAEVYLEQARARLDDGQIPDRAVNELYRGHVASAKGLYDTAARSYLSAAPLFLQADEVEGAALVQLALARIYLQQERFGDAESAIGEAVSLGDGIVAPEVAASTHLHRGLLFALTERAPQALAELELADALMTDGRFPLLRPLYHQVHASALSGRGDRIAARQAWERALAASTAIEDRAAEVEVLGELAKLRASLGQLMDAERLALACLNEATRLRMRAPRALALVTLAEIHTANNEPARARERIDEAVEIAATINLPAILRRTRRLTAASTQD